MSDKQQAANANVDTSKTLKGVHRNLDNLRGPSSVAQAAVQVANSIPQLGGHVGLPPSALNAIQAVSSVPRFDHLTEIQESLRPTIESCEKTSEFAKALESAFDPISRVLASVSSQLEGYEKFRESAVAKLVSAMERAASFDWGPIAKGSGQWGMSGWAIVSSLFDDVSLPPCPSKLDDADAICLSLIDIDVLFEELENSVIKKKDFRETVELFREGLYRPCAMMLCALIDRELFGIFCPSTRSEGAGKSNQRSWKAGLKPLKNALVDEEGYHLPNEVFSAIDFINISESVEYFFKSGDNFDPECEGELNRHFLNHGMMDKPVHRATCIKLFVLLDAISSILPSVAECLSGTMRNAAYAS